MVNKSVVNYYIGGIFLCFARLLISKIYLSNMIIKNMVGNYHKWNYHSLIWNSDFWNFAKSTLTLVVWRHHHILAAFRSPFQMTVHLPVDPNGKFGTIRHWSIPYSKMECYENLQEANVPRRTRIFPSWRWKSARICTKGQGQWGRQMRPWAQTIFWLIDFHQSKHGRQFGTESIQKQQKNSSCLLRWTSWIFQSICAVKINSNQKRFDEKLFSAEMSKM